jgi:hypothetical protein
MPAHPGTTVHQQSSYRGLRRYRRLWSATLALALVGVVGAGCTAGPPAPATGNRVPVTGTTGPIDALTRALADRLTAPAYTRDTTAAMIAALARSGVGTFADPESTTPEQPVTAPASAMRLLDFQAHALAVGAWAGADYTGAELDTVLPRPVGNVALPSTSELLAGYVAAAGTPGAALARELMSGQNLRVPTGLRFPGVVLVLFAADMAGTDTAGTGTASSTAPTSSRPPTNDARSAGGMDVRTVPASTDGPCSITATWINNTIVGFFSALRLATPTNLPGAIVVSIWNWLVDAGQAFVQNLVSATTDVVLGTIRSIAAGVSAAAMQIAAILPYAVKVIASGDTGGATFHLGSAPLSGTFTATVTAGDLPDWPSVLADCAAVAKVALPDFHAKDIPLTWGPLDAPADVLLGPAASAHDTDITDASGRATWDFQTATEPGDPDGEQRSQVDAMPVAVHRPEIARARARLTEALLGYIPGLLRPFVARVFAPYIDGLQDRLNSILDARGRGTAFLIYHAGKPPTPSQSASPATCTASPVLPGTYTGTNTNTFTDKISITGGGLVDHNSATGPVTLTVMPGGSVTGRWSFRMRQVSDENASFGGVSMKYHSERTWDMTAGTITGTVCDIGLTSSPVRQVTCVGTCGNGTAATAPQGSLPSLGPPVSATPGHLTWQFTANSTGTSTYVDTFTITVTGPQ